MLLLKHSTSTRKDRDETLESASGKGNTTMLRTHKRNRICSQILRHSNTDPKRLEGVTFRICQNTEQKQNQHINNIGLDCNFTKTLVYRYDLADLLMSRCGKTKTCLKECHNIKPQKIVASPILWGGTRFEKLEHFKWNGVVKKRPSKIQRHYGD